VDGWKFGTVLVSSYDMSDTFVHLAVGSDSLTGNLTLVKWATLSYREQARAQWLEEMLAEDIKSSQYTISWHEKVTVSIPCWWRRLLRLPLRTVMEWQRRIVAVESASEVRVMWLPHDANAQTFQIEEVTMSSPYVAVGRPPSFETDSYSWEGYPHPVVCV